MTAITFSFRICFYDRDPPTPTTRCYIDFRMHGIKDEQVQRGCVEKFAIEPAFTRHTLGGRAEFSEYTIFRPLTAGNAQSDRALKLVEDWMRECSLHHEFCNHLIRDRNKNILPARLISVDKRGQLQLTEIPQASEPHHRYATLTHRWGTDRRLLLSRTNKDELEGEIPVHSLPAVYRDAVWVCRFLDIPDRHNLYHAG
jgi:hypothetical protein